MFKRLRQLNISLAAKCQLLFGAAVVVIISAALFVPWQRMEQLTEQLNDRSARTLADYTIDSHVGRKIPTTVPATRPASALPPTTQPLQDARDYAPPRLILATTKTEDVSFTPFERRAIRRLLEHPEREFDSRLDDTRYLFARIDTGCTKCHSAPLEAHATTLPTTAPAKNNIIGLVSVDIPSQIETSQLLLNRVFLLTAGMLAGVLAIIVFYLITTRLILEPVRVLQNTAEKVSQGDLNIRSDISTGDEFQQLSETFNTMLTNLKQSADQLRAVNKSLDLKLGQLAESNVALYESNRLKTEFLANVSHELRTPLNSILGFAELLRDASAADAKSIRYIQNILNSGRNLLDLINDLLDLAKIEAGRMEVRSEPLSLGDLFEALISILKPLAEARKINIVPTVAVDVPIIDTDPAKLQQVLYNFLSNAIKFSPQGASIDLTAERVEETGVRISVTDRGPGIDPSKHEVIFEKFRQVDATVTREHGGTGLGLAISKELTALLGGTIGVASSPGEGATFWIILPTKIASGPHDLRERLVTN